ncbi:Centromere protein 3 [Cyphellophora attinorum]|uniref:CENP-C homolog n=1 Tax=Cyphellophora attinorum TaxID=1664694 RepID=A0A0N1H4M3_9EURO|nr:Centromere protein 3 [Phialophora attinorum]KPI35717.1 Centromere protein 3 [Phialophora attinorum]
MARRNAQIRTGDFVSVGRVGRRTGLELPVQVTGEDGLEQIDNIFSSPAKPSPLRQAHSVEDFERDALPAPKSIRRSLPRSVSPRKTNISGRARRSNGGFRTVHSDDEADEVPDDAPVSSPSRANTAALRSSVAFPLRDITNETTVSPRAKRKSIIQSIEEDYQSSDSEQPQVFVDDAPAEIDDYQGEPEDQIEADIPIQEPIDDEEEAQIRQQPAPPAKKAKSKALTRTKTTKRGRPPLKAKDNNQKMSKRQEKELDEVVERVKARPDPPRSLYVLRKETPADPNVHLTRSGRMTVKPLAYWRNERCVWGGSPNTELKEGARFPMNSIKEIIRTEDHNTPIRKGKKSRKGKQKKKAATAEDDSSSDEEATYVEPWEVDTGTIHGTVSEWDSLEGLPLNTLQQIEIAHSSQAIQTYVPQPKNGQEPAQFRYSKLFSNNFMSVGLVDLPPGGIKKPKNSQKMQMTFYVLKGRVTVSVGPILGTMTTFGIGKGGFWQVPRGNQYSIENEHGTEARLVFCQGCMVDIAEEEEAEEE